MVALLGRNGMGKTTTVQSIVGFTPPRRGEIWFKDQDVSRMPSHRIARMGMGLVPQGRRIFSSLSVKENLTIAERLGKRESNWTLEAVYSLFPVLEERADNRGNMLSGGEQQMLCLGRALMTNPDFLVMDEPSEGLAPLIVAEVGTIIRKLKAEGLSILLTEQNLHLALAVSDYVYIISKGKIVYGSTPEELRKDEEAQHVHLAVNETPRSGVQT